MTTFIEFLIYETITDNFTLLVVAEKLKFIFRLGVQVKLRPT
jgi:hypothetical protein